jgi:hypothetical protein
LDSKGNVIKDILLEDYAMDKVVWRYLEL